MIFQLKIFSLALLFTLGCYGVTEGSIQMIDAFSAAKSSPAPSRSQRTSHKAPMVLRSIATR